MNSITNGRKTAVILIFTLLLILAIGGNIAGASEQPEPQSPTAVTPTFTVQFSSDGVTFTDDISVDQGDEVWVRLNYDNTGDEQATAAQTSLTLPAGFTLVGSSTRTCLTPSGAETVCNTDAGMGGAITEGTVWTGSALAMGPQDGLYNQAVDGTTSIIEFGKLRYVNLQECRAEQGSTDIFYTTLRDTGTNASNTADGAATCTGVYAGYTVTPNQVLNLDLLGLQYFNLQDCQYISNADRIGVNTANTATSNTAATVLDCPAGAGAHSLEDGSFAALDLVGNPFLNLKECQLFASPDSISFNLRGGADTNTGTAADTVNNCSAASAPGYAVTDNTQLPLDLRDSTRGAGFVEFKLDTSGATDDVHNLSANLTDESGNSEFSNLSDNGDITVTTVTATTTITSGDDTDDGLCAPAPGHCSLREAVDQANANGGGLVDFADSMIDGTVTLDPTVNGPLATMDNIVIDGTTRNVTITNAPFYPVQPASGSIFNINTDKSVTFRNLTFTLPAGGQGSSHNSGVITMQNGGELTLDTVIFQDSVVMDYGIIRIQQGAGTVTPTVTIADSQFLRNRSNAYGSGVMSMSGGTLTITDSDFIGNAAAIYVGALSVAGADVTIQNSQFISNTSASATGYGVGALALNASEAVIEDSLFQENSTASSGGAISTANNTPVTINNSDFISNTAGGHGGGIYSDGALTVTNNDYTSNTAGASGGAIYNTNGELVITGSTIEGNRSDRANDGYGGGAIWTTAPMTMDSTDVLNNFTSMDFTIYAAEPITVTNSLFQGNAVNDDAAALAAYSSAVIANTDFIENTSDGIRGTTGDSVVNIAGEATLTNVKFMRNSFTNGGATLLLAGTSSSVTDSQFISNTVSHNGASIHNGSALTVDNVDFTENTASQGGAIYNSGNITITNSTFISNTGTADGGALYLNEGITNISDSSFTGNNDTVTATNVDGGAILNHSASTLSVENTSFNRNAAHGNASEGGAILNFGTLTVDTSTFSENYGNNGGDWGGGAVLNAGTATFTNTTFYNNTTVMNGSAIAHRGTSLTVVNSTLSDNNQTSGGAIHLATGNAHLINTIVANSNGGVDCGGTPTTNTNNLIEDGTCSPAISGDPMLGTLEYTGLGNTGILPLLAGSPAIDAGDDASAAATDQRGISRPQGCASDIGAYEVEGTCGPALSLAKTAVNITGAPLVAGDTIEYVVTVTNELDSSQAGVVITDAIPASTTYVAGSASVSQGSVSGPDPLVADIGTLAANASATLTFRVTVDSDAVGETIQNSAQAASPDQPEPVEVGPIEPDGGGLVLPSADLMIAQSIELVYLQTIFTIEVDNNGPDAAPGTVISVTFPVEITDVAWTCVGSGGAVCPADSGSGNTIHETVATFPADGNLTYTVETSPPWEPITNLAEVIPSADVVDPDMTNNQSEQVTSYKLLLPLVFKN